ncbi:hypothetical protein AJ79_08331 [Helicocarpus griseus UAMH5409]|uniref:Aminoglycoside phosphotransferase domain-containing protein n=1 Tax=Helicocarpus griseus UAMH5409 TaxID=1447875 RepID=A0A2B7WTZ3_9EURO|nr:hypothetical protein AJ79_08331 [Helicocarpus griseus UAMH5409]
MATLWQGSPTSGPIISEQTNVNAGLDLKTAVLHTRFRIARSVLDRSLGPTLVRVGWNHVIKGPCHPPELEALLYVTEHTTIPVPRVRYTYNGPGGIYISMDYIKGTNLETLWMLGLLKPGEQNAIVNDMAAILSQLRALRPPKEGIVASTQGGPILDYRIVKLFGEEVAICHRNSYRTYFSHADLAPRNIIICNGRIVGVVDWATAGWYPEYWDLTKAYFTSFKVPEWYERLNLKLPSYSSELMAEKILWTLYDKPGNVTHN